MAGYPELTLSVKILWFRPRKTLRHLGLFTLGSTFARVDTVGLPLCTHLTWLPEEVVYDYGLVSLTFTPDNKKTRHS